MLKKISIKLLHWTINAIYLQLFIAIMTAPILIYWGIPLSITAAIGNILCAPILLLFLTFSSFIFVCEIIHIPNAIFIYLLELTTSILDQFIHYGSRYMLFGYAHTSLYFALIMSIATLCIIHHKYYHRGIRGLIALCIIACIAHGSYALTYKQKLLSTISCKKGKIIFLHTKNENIAIGIGMFGKHKASDSYVQYQLIPKILKTTGSLSCKHFVVLNPLSSNLYTAQALCNNIQLNTLHLPEVKTKFNTRALQSLKKICPIQNVNVITHTNICTIELPKLTVHISPALLKKY